MPLRTAEIFFKDRHAGLLAETAGGGTRFTYDARWRDPIACCFPTAQREHEWRPGLHPFFQHLGPEGWLREKQARGAHLAEEDDLGLLLRYGADCIGAVGVGAAVDPSEPAEATELLSSPGRTVSGVQRKLLVTGDARAGFEPAASRGFAPFIAKFNAQDLPTLVQNEALSLRWTAAVLGAKEVTEFRTAFVAALDEVALVVTRFDRGPHGEKLRLEDCAQILCKPKGQDHSGKYEAAYEDVADLIKTHSVRPTIDLARFFRRLVVFVLVGNCDAHLKNFSMLETPDGLRLSPAYDVVNTAVYDGFDQRLALTIGGRKIQHGDADAALFRAFGRRIGLPERAVERALVEVRRGVRNAAPILASPSAHAADGFKARYEQIVSGACLRVLE